MKRDRSRLPAERPPLKGTPPSRRILAVGVTGGIGSGKSEACRVFASLGGTVCSADELARSLMTSDPALRQRLTRSFGPETYLADGSLNRKHLAKRIFTDPAARETIDAIVHPFVLKAMGDRIALARKEGEPQLLFFEAALLYEAGADDMFDYMIVVDAAEPARLERLVTRDGLTAAEATARLRAQMPAAQKASRADLVIVNNGDRRTFEEKCRFIYGLLTAIAARPAGEEQA